mgnify:CR=1 FL=1
MKFERVTWVVWIPDGMKDTPVDRVCARTRLTDALDAVFSERMDPALTAESVGLRADDVVFGVVGTLRPYKGLDDLLDAFAAYGVAAVAASTCAPCFARSCRRSS